MDFKNKVVVITGGAQGIGKEFSKSFAERKAKVMVLDNNDKGSETSAEIKGEGGFGEYFNTDVSSWESVELTFSKIIEVYGGIDILINNAGVVSPKPIMETTEKDFDFIISVNLKGVYNTSKVVIPFMMAQGKGKIINIASVAGKRGGGLFGNSIYAASKAGVIGFTKSLARELSKHNINVNAICPGPTGTDMLKGMTDEQKAKVIGGIPLGRFATPRDITGGVLFLASEYSNFITGEIMDIDGGIMMD